MVTDVSQPQYAGSCSMKWSSLAVVLMDIDLFSTILSNDYMVLVYLQNKLLISFILNFMLFISCRYIIYKFLKETQHSIMDIFIKNMYRTLPIVFVNLA